MPDLQILIRGTEILLVNHNNKKCQKRSHFTSDFTVLKILKWA